MYLVEGERPPPYRTKECAFMRKHRGKMCNIQPKVQFWLGIRRVSELSGFIVAVGRWQKREICG
jgi:hypothetical protein